MKLTFDEIKSIANGAVRILQEENGIRFWRFTPEQEALYIPYREATDMNYRRRSLSSSCVKLAFSTNSTRLFLKADVEKATTRTFFDFEIKVNGEPVGVLTNHEGSYPHGTPGEKYPLGVFEKEFDLGEGEKTVEVFFPWSVCPLLQEISLDDGATLKPVKRSKKLLIFGDSITQGYDMLQPSQHYTVLLSDYLNAEAYNKAVGGEVIFPPLAHCGDDFQPDYITVAYGSNNFGKTDSVGFVEDSREFFGALREKYPNAMIFALTPVWRADADKVMPFGSFASVEEKLLQAIADVPGVIPIYGYDLVPHDIAFYSDLRLHPNDEGFAHFAKNLIAQVAKYTG